MAKPYQHLSIGDRIFIAHERNNGVRRPVRNPVPKPFSGAKNLLIN